MRPGLQAARRATNVLFLLNGLAFATWGVHVPTFKLQHGLDEAAKPRCRPAAMGRPATVKLTGSGHSIGPHRQWPLWNANVDSAYRPGAAGQRDHRDVRLSADNSPSTFDISHHSQWCLVLPSSAVAGLTAIPTGAWRRFLGKHILSALNVSRMI